MILLKRPHMHILPSSLNLKIKNLNVKNVVNAGRWFNLWGMGEISNNLHFPLCR
jgi:hypothetical protein